MSEPDAGEDMSVAGLAGKVDLTVVVPAYNEERRLARSLDAICAYLAGGEQSWELIVVDDGSTDGSPAIMASVAAAQPCLRIIESTTNWGKGHAVRSGVLASRGAYVLICDADLAAPIEEVEPLLKALADGHSVAIGSRAGPTSKIEIHQGRLRETVGRLGNLLIRTVAVPGIADTQCGFKLFEGDVARAVFARAKLDGWGFDVEILHLCCRFGWPVVEVPVRWAHQPHSKVRPLDYLRVLGDVFYVKLTHRRTRLLDGAPVGLANASQAPPRHRLMLGRRKRPARSSQ
jgi:glycosyltransferase involved in cell wall biosynthesis